MSDDKKCCGECRWFTNAKVYPDEDGMVYRGRVFGNCSALIPAVVLDMYPEIAEQAATWPLLDTDCTDCPCFERKEK